MQLFIGLKNIYRTQSYIYTSILAFGVLGSDGGFVVLFRLSFSGASLVAQSVKNPPAMQQTLVRFLGQEDPLEKE